MTKSSRSCQMTLFGCIRQRSPGTNNNEQSTSKTGKFAINLEASSADELPETIQVDNNKESTTVLCPPKGPLTSESNSKLIRQELLLDSSKNCTLATALSSPSWHGIQAPKIRLSDRVDDIAPTITFPPLQPTDVIFPVTFFSKKPRSFNVSWYLTHPWLEYSVKQDAAFCYPYRLFDSEGAPSSRPEKTFTTIGFKDWNMQLGNKAFLHAMPTATRTNKLCSPGTSTNLI